MPTATTETATATHVDRLIGNRRPSVCVAEIAVPAAIVIAWSVTAIAVPWTAPATVGLTFGKLACAHGGLCLGNSRRLATAPDEMALIVFMPRLSTAAAAQAEVIALLGDRTFGIPQTDPLRLGARCTGDGHHRHRHSDPDAGEESGIAERSFHRGTPPRFFHRLPSSMTFCKQILKTRAKTRRQVSRRRHTKARFSPIVAPMAKELVPGRRN